ncbi:hypothetical protein M569_04209 [Genlisea aurea]|uniref:peptidylprolyl isomerase n=1 Tax=Genlisea aurea TaxID=192259 RepID=S8E485_9LAMI|nr:hypothetical protein M569_04209 [Genlisea aurea]
MAVIEESDNPQKKKPPSEDEKRRKKITPGSLMKALIRPGAGESTPSDGDQIMYHCTIRTLDGVIVESTRPEFGGNGIPKRQVLGKSKILLGLLEGIPTMLHGEVAMFKMKPEMHYGEEKCPLISGTSGDGKILFARTTGEPFLFTFGKSEIPKGLEMGIGTMAKGEKAVIYVMKEYLAECTLIPSIKDISEIHFEVELVHFVQVRDVLGDGRLIKRRLHDGRGEFPMDCPLHDSLLHVHYRGMLPDEAKTIFYDTRVHNSNQPLEFRSGEGLVPEGFEMCTRLMLPGEIALVTCPPDYAYDKFPRPSEVPPGAYVQWEIELLDYEKQKDWTGFNFREIMNDVDKIKGTGNRLFKQGKYELAKAKYEHVLREFNHVNPQDDEEGKEFSDMRNLVNLNVAACWLKMGEFRKSIETCNKVLDTNPFHVKALYRRGMASLAAGSFDEARADFNQMMTVDKSSEASAKAALLKLKKEEQETHRRAREQFKGLFDKKPGEISEAGLVDEIRGSDEDADEEEEEEKERLLEADTATVPPPPPRSRFLSNVWWPSARKLFGNLGLNSRCAIL